MVVPFWFTQVEVPKLAPKLAWLYKEYEELLWLVSELSVTLKFNVWPFEK